MSFPCLSGLHERERQKPQTLVVEVGVALDLDPAASGDIGASVNYALLLEQVAFIALEGRWRLLESMVAAIARHLLSPPASGEARAQIDAVRIKVAKPDIFAGRAVPSVEVVRDRWWYRPRPQAHGDGPGVTVEVREQAAGAAAYRGTLGPNMSFGLPGGAAAQVLSGSVLSDEQPLGPGDRARAPARLRSAANVESRVLVVTASAPTV
jgi:FolB domain-containing protein